MKIQEYIEQVHQTATEHGWHEQKQSTEHWLMLIITEICEMIEADRENNHAHFMLTTKGNHLFNTTLTLQRIFFRLKSSPILLF